MSLILLKNIRKYNLTNRFTTVSVMYSAHFNELNIIETIKFLGSSRYALESGFVLIFNYVNVYDRLIYTIKNRNSANSILQELIKSYVTDMNLMLLSIMQCAISELNLIDNYDDYKVLVNDYLTISGYLCDVKHKAFVNAIIEKVYNNKKRFDNLKRLL